MKAATRTLLTPAATADTVGDRVPKGHGFKIRGLPIDTYPENTAFLLRGGGDFAPEQSYVKCSR